MEYARPGDTIVIWKLDRLERSTVKIIELMKLLKQKRINLKSLSESIDTGTATGNLFFQFMCVLAENERNVISERTKAGLESARARGRSGGRPKGLSQRYLKISKKVKEMYGKKIYSTDAIREMFQIKSQPTLYKILKYAGADVKGFIKKRSLTLIYQIFKKITKTQSKLLINS